MRLLLVFLLVSAGDHVQAMRRGGGATVQTAGGGGDGDGDGNDGNKKGGWPGKKMTGLDPVGAGDQDNDDDDDEEEGPTIGMRGTARYCNVCGELSYVGGGIGCLSKWCQAHYTCWMQWRDAKEVQKHLPEGIVKHRAKRCRGAKRRENKRRP